MAVVAGINFWIMHQLCLFLDQETLLSDTHPLVISEMDYYNVLYIGQVLKSIWKLQLVQNVAVLGVPAVVHVTPLLHKLHWVAVCFWIQIKVLVITVKALHDMRPGYLRNHLNYINLSYLIKQVGHAAYFIG